MPKQKDNRSESITRGSKNVFADLGYSDAVERQAKLRLAYALNQSGCACRHNAMEQAARTPGHLLMNPAVSG